MRIIEGFTLRCVADEYIVSGEGVTQINFNKLIALNESAAYLWKNVEGVDFTVDTLSALLVEMYGINPEMASSDAHRVAQSWLEAGIVAE